MMCVMPQVTSAACGCCGQACAATRAASGPRAGWDGDSSSGLSADSQRRLWASICQWKAWLPDPAARHGNDSRKVICEVRSHAHHIVLTAFQGGMGLLIRMISLQCIYRSMFEQHAYSRITASLLLALHSLLISHSRPACVVR